MLDVGCMGKREKVLDVGCWMLDVWAKGKRCWMLDVGCWMYGQKGNTRPVAKCNEAYQMNLNNQ